MNRSPECGGFKRMPHSGVMRNSCILFDGATFSTKESKSIESLTTAYKMLFGTVMLAGRQ